MNKIQELENEIKELRKRIKDLNNELIKVKYFVPTIDQVVEVCLILKQLGLGYPIYALIIKDYYFARNFTGKCLNCNDWLGTYYMHYCENCMCSYCYSELMHCGLLYKPLRSMVRKEQIFLGMKETEYESINKKKLRSQRANELQEFDKRYYTLFGHGKPKLKKDIDYHHNISHISHIRNQLDEDIKKVFDLSDEDFKTTGKVLATTFMAFMNSGK